MPYSVVWADVIKGDSRREKRHSYGQSFFLVEKAEADKLRAYIAGRYKRKEEKHLAHLYEPNLNSSYATEGLLYMDAQLVEHDRYHFFIFDIVSSCSLDVIKPQFAKWEEMQKQCYSSKLNRLLGDVFLGQGSMSSRLQSLKEAVEDFLKPMGFIETLDEGEADGASFGFQPYVKSPNCSQ